MTPPPLSDAVRAPQNSSPVLPSSFPHFAVVSAPPCGTLQTAQPPRQTCHAAAPTAAALRATSPDLRETIAVLPEASQNHVVAAMAPAAAPHSVDVPAQAPQQPQQQKQRHQYRTRLIHDVTSMRQRRLAATVSANDAASGSLRPLWVAAAVMWNAVWLAAAAARDLIATVRCGDAAAAVVVVS